jgi:ketosteroid isomerase-like protein
MSQENVELVRTLFERTARGDLRAPDLVDPSIEHVRIGFDGVGLSGRWSGHDGLWTAVLDIVRVFDDLRMEAEQFIDLDQDGVLALGRISGVGRISGAPFEAQAAHLFRFRNGLIVRWEVYAERDEARRAVGLAD